MRIATVVVLAVLGLPSLAQEVSPSAAEQVEAAVLKCLADGPHHRRCEPLAAIGPSAVDPLAAILRDEARSEVVRTLAAQALGRLGESSASKPLRDAAEAEETPPAVREAAESGLYLLGDTSAVDGRVERLLVKYSAIPVARAAAWERLARTYAATSRFDSAVRVWRQVVEAADEEQRKRLLSYDLACFEALAGHREAALEAVRSALGFEGVDLDWMARDGDLRLLHRDPEFVALIAAAKDDGAAEAPRASPPEPTPEEAAYRKFSRSYWDGAFEAYVEAQNRYWEGYQDWREAQGREPGDDSAAAWKELRGPQPENPTPGWIARFREEIARHEGTSLAPRIRDDLLTILGNEDMAEDWTALFLETAQKTPEHAGVGDHAASALHWSEQAGRREETLAALQSVLKAHPRAPSGAGIRMALAEERREANAELCARSLYAEVLEIYPKAPQADEARGALYEMDYLAPGHDAPVFETKDIHGHPIRLADLRGKVVLLDFWATWCGPCLGELPHVKKLHADFSGREDFVLIGVSLDGDGIALLDFLEAEGMSWPQVCGLAEFRDPLPRLYNVRGIPDTFVIDREGKIVVRGLRGEDLREAVRKALDRAK